MMRRRAGHRSRRPGAWLGQAAGLLALATLLFSQALVPHLTSLSSRSPQGGVAAAEAHIHTDARQGDDRPAHESVAHQVCHFCRLGGAVLPPPPAGIIGIVALQFDAPAWDLADEAIKPAEHFQTGHEVRGPPPIA
jgi:hypothetical protein